MFLKEFDKLSAKHRKAVLKTLRVLSDSPFYPSLRTKKILGDRYERYESSVNMDIRVIWRYDGEKIIVALDVGHHDVLRKY
jgi:mRNA-degrading endonuclease RelE of RelBE toxin-antitoxin system